MQQKQNLLEELERLLAWKKSRQFYADKLGISIAYVDELLREIRGEDEETEAVSGENIVRHNIDKGIMEVSSYYDKAPSPEQIIKDHNIDLTKWKLSNFWSKQKSKGYQVSALFTQLTAKDNQQEQFLSFLKNYKPQSKQIIKAKNVDKLPTSCLVINKQDSHLNKKDINGDNNINTRFANIEFKIDKILNKAQVGTFLEKVVYIIGSDEFNSESTGLTTKGTPQSNILSYHESFEEICEHEVRVIDTLLTNASEVDVIYICGNHDFFVGWHLASWLKAYFKNQKGLNIDISPNYTKYVQFSNTAMCFNHGDVMKPEVLARNFPIEFKEKWSECDFYYVFTGDKHTELSRDIGGIRFFRIPALSKSVSSWDSHNGYTKKYGEMTAFLIEKDNGMSDIYKEIL